MKKAVYLLCTLLLSIPFCFADETDEVKEFFNDYVQSANSYERDSFKYYSDNAKIVRIVEKPDGTLQSVNIPLERYKKEAAKSVFLAKLRRYKNKYFNIRVSKHGDDYRLSAERMPSLSSYKIPAEFIIGKDNSGNWKIKEEYLNTKVQRFLKED